MPNRKTDLPKAVSTVDTAGALESAEGSDSYASVAIAPTNISTALPYTSQSAPYAPQIAPQHTSTALSNPVQSSATPGAASVSPPNPFEASLEASRLTSPVQVSNLAPGRLNSGRALELEADAKRNEPERLVHADIIDLDDIKMCKRDDGEDWLLGRGSYGMVGPALYLCLPLPFSPACPWPFSPGFLLTLSVSDTNQIPCVLCCNLWVCLIKRDAMRTLLHHGYTGIPRLPLLLVTVWHKLTQYVQCHAVASVYTVASRQPRQHKVKQVVPMLP